MPPLLQGSSNVHPPPPAENTGASGRHLCTPTFVLLMVMINWTATGRFKDPATSGEEAGAGLFCFVYCCKASVVNLILPFPPFLGALFYEGFHTVVISALSSPNNRQGGRLGREGLLEINTRLRQKPGDWLVRVGVFLLLGTGVSSTPRVTMQLISTHAGWPEF